MAQTLLAVAWLLVVGGLVTIALEEQLSSNALYIALHILRCAMLTVATICAIAALLYICKDSKNAGNTEETAIKDVADGYELYLDGNCVQKTEGVTIDEEKYEISIDDNEKCIYLERK